MSLNDLIMKGLKDFQIVNREERTSDNQNKSRTDTCSPRCTKFKTNSDTRSPRCTK